MIRPDIQVTAAPLGYGWAGAGAGFLKVVRALGQNHSKKDVVRSGCVPPVCGWAVGRESDTRTSPNIGHSLKN